MDKAVVTVVGKDTVGIIAKVCTYLADEHINILDISQTIVDGFFNMMMVVDIGRSRKVFDTIRADLLALADGMGLELHCQKAEIFEKMHRI